MYIFSVNGRDGRLYYWEEEKERASSKKRNAIVTKPRGGAMTVLHVCTYIGGSYELSENSSQASNRS